MLRRASPLAVGAELPRWNRDLGEKERREKRGEGKETERGAVAGRGIHVGVGGHHVGSVIDREFAWVRVIAKTGLGMTSLVRMK